jgi:UDP-glucose 4-epimerase
MPSSANPRILVTGATGLLGSRLVPQLWQQGASLFLLGRTPLSFQSKSSRIHFLKCDFANPKTIDRHHRTLQTITQFVHLGGFVLKSRDPSQDSLEKSLILNPLATEKILSHLSPRLQQIVYASTLDVYGTPKQLPIRENAPLQPNTYYAMSKVATEQLLQISAERSSISLTTLRFTSLYGPGDDSAKIIPYLVQCALTKKRPTLTNRGKARRDFLYVDDAVAALRIALQKQRRGTFNIASGSSASILKVFQMIEKLTHSSLKPKFVLSQGPSYDTRLSIQRAQRELGFSPKISLEEGLRQTIAWFKGNPSLRSR